MRTPVLLSLGIVMSGCIAQPPASEAIAAASLDDPIAPPEVVCKKEKPTGSNRPVTVCREVQSALDQEHTRRDMKVLQRQSDVLSQEPAK